MVNVIVDVADAVRIGEWGTRWQICSEVMSWIFHKRKLVIMHVGKRSVAISIASLSHNAEHQYQ